MPHPNPTDWLIDRYANRPAAIRKLIGLAADLPAKWDADQEGRYRGRVISLLENMLEVADDIAVTDKAKAFRQRFTMGSAMEIQRFMVYLIHQKIPDQDWPDPVTWDHVSGCPRVYHLESTLAFAEAIVLDLLAHRFRETRGDK